MNIMNMPGFTAESSIYNTVSHFQSETVRGFGSGKNYNQVYMQRPKKENTPGDKCNATSASGTSTVNTGTYDANGDCCGPKLSNGSKLCINCDTGTCSDGHAPLKGVFDRFTIGNFQRGVVVRFLS